jgi:hypothetical protein
MLSDIPTLKELSDVTGQNIEQLRRDRNAFDELSKLSEDD